MHIRTITKILCLSHSEKSNNNTAKLTLYCFNTHVFGLYYDYFFNYKRVVKRFRECKVQNFATGPLTSFVSTEVVCWIKNATLLKQ